MTDQNWQLKEGDQFAPTSPDALEHLPSHHCAASASAGRISNDMRFVRIVSFASEEAGSICESSCKVAEESPPVPDIKSLLKLMAYRTHTTGPKTLAAHLTGAADHIEALERDLADASKDAARYRYIRNSTTLDAVVWAALEGVSADDESGYTVALDESIDAAMKEQA